VNRRFGGCQIMMVWMSLKQNFQILSRRLEPW
jgi:hypothetical protein